MSIVESLRGDHEVIRGALAELKTALQEAATAEAVHERVAALVQVLGRHCRQEGEALQPFASRLRMLPDAWGRADHVEADVVLRDLEVLRSAWQSHPTPLLAVHLYRLLDELQERLDEEEQRLFPVVEAPTDRTESLVKAWG